MLNLQNPKQRSIIILIFVIVIILIGFLLYYLPNKKNPPPKTETPTTTSEKEREFTVPDTLYNLTGEITEFKEGAIIFEAKIPLVDDKGRLNYKLETRKILITSETEFTKLNFIVNKETGKEIPTEVKISLKDFEVGNLIEVHSIGDISKKEEFAATKVRLLSSKK